MMGFTDVDGDGDSIEVVEEADASSTIIVSFDFSDCIDTAETNRRLIRPSSFLSYSIYPTKMYILHSSMSN